MVRPDVSGNIINEASLKREGREKTAYNVARTRPANIAHTSRRTCREDLDRLFARTIKGILRPTHRGQFVTGKTLVYTRSRVSS